MAIRLSISVVKQDPKVLITGQTSTTGSVIYHTTRTDEKERWEKIAARIDGDARNAIDIGCNRGAITRRAADMGLFSIGIDIEKENIKMARKLTDNPNCHYFSQELNPESINTIPNFDVGFVLAVFYHWGNQFGWSKAEAMLREVAMSTDQLFIETECGFNKIKSERLDTDIDPEQALFNYFDKILPEALLD